MKHVHYVLAYITLFLFILARTTGSLTAAPPPSPINVQAFYQKFNNQEPDHWVNWNMPQGIRWHNTIEDSGFNVYLAKDGSADFIKVFTTPLGEIIAEGDGVDIVTHFPWYYEADIADIEAGVYQYYMTAYNPDGESSPSNLYTLDIYSLGGVWISQDSYALEATVNKLFTWTTQAQNETNQETRFLLDPNIGIPTGMEIDKFTGEISWKPQAPGQYKTVVYAYAFSPPNIYIFDTTSVFLTVTQGDNSSEVKEKNDILTSLLVAPNPAASRVEIRFHAPPGKQHLHMVNVKGEEVMVRTLYSAGGETVLELNDLDLENGIYRIVIENEEKIMQQSLIIAR